MSILSNMIHRYNTTPINSQSGSFSSNPTSCFSSLHGRAKAQRSRCPWREEKAGGPSSSQVSCCTGTTKADQRGKIECLETDTQRCRKFVYDKVGTAGHSQKQVLVPLQLVMRNTRKENSCLPAHTQFNSKQIKGLNVKSNTSDSVGEEKKGGKRFYNFKVGKDFLKITIYMHRKYPQ